MTDKEYNIEDYTKDNVELANEVIKELIEQLKRLEAENKAITQTSLDRIEYCKKLKVENARLKEEFKRLKESECKICKYFNIGDKYKQTLQDIKAIVEENQFYFGEATIVSYKTIKQLATNFKKILDLITKVESEW